MSDYVPHLGTLVQRDQCRPDLLCISCGARLGHPHEVLCYTAALARLEPNYCGCCGNETHGSDDLWCARCVGHVGRYGHLDERTWFALTGEACPYQAGPNSPSAAPAGGDG